MKSSACAFGIAALLVLGCGDVIPATQVMVVIEAEAGVRAQTHDVRLAVRSGQGEMSKWEERYDKTLALDADKLRWPLEFALVPKNDDATRVYTVTATALDRQGTAIAVVRAVSGYVKTRVLKLVLKFDDNCIGKALLCDEAQTCVDGTCTNARVLVNLLPGYTPTENSDAGAHMRDGGNGGTDGRDGSMQDSGASTRLDAAPQDAGALSSADAARVELDAAGGLDAAVASGTDAAVVAPGTTCDPCSTTADCVGGYVCVYRDIDTAKHCFAQFPQYATGCSTYAPGQYAATSGNITTCYPSASGTGSPPGRDCASWRAIYLP